MDITAQLAASSAGIRAATLPPEAIERITYGLARAGMLLVDDPAEKNANSQYVVDGEFNGPFVLCAALVPEAMIGKQLVLNCRVQKGSSHAAGH